MAKEHLSYKGVWDRSLAVLHRCNVRSTAWKSSPKARGRQSRETINACQALLRAPTAEQNPPRLHGTADMGLRGVCSLELSSPAPGQQLQPCEAREDESLQAFAPRWKLHSPVLATGLPQHLAHPLHPSLACKAGLMPTREIFLQQEPCRFPAGPLCPGVLRLFEELTLLKKNAEVLGGPEPLDSQH